jgi:ADP-heptose:LPS heptosyltransferase
MATAPAEDGLKLSRWGRTIVTGRGEMLSGAMANMSYSVHAKPARTTNTPRRRILVIKLGALGDFVHAMHGFAAIRAHHQGDHIALLTTAPFASLARSAPWFDEVLLDSRAAWLNFPAILRTISAMRGFDFVYDLQTSRRTERYFWLAGRPPWSGIAWGCSHPHSNPGRDSMHTLERQREQLAIAGIDNSPVPDRSWLVADGHLHGVTPPYALLMPGGAGAGAPKRWPAEHYAAVAKFIFAAGLTPVVIGGAPEANLGKIISVACPAALDLSAKTTIADIAALGAGADLVVGNDTGPVQLAAALGAPTIALFSSTSSPQEASPRGPSGEWVTVLSMPALKDLAVEQVVTAITEVLQARPAPGSRVAPVATVG